MTVEVKMIENGKYILLIDGKEKTFQELRERVNKNETNKKKK